MPKRILVIDGDNQGFFLSVDQGTVTIGEDPTRPGAHVRGLHVSRIHCEVEVTEEVISIESETSEHQAPESRSLRVGSELHVGRAHLRLQATPGGNGSAAPAAAAAPAFSPAPGGPPGLESMYKRLVVIDGADQGRSFFLPNDGSTTIGNSPKHADIVLHDLYVARVHAEVTVHDDQVWIMPSRTDGSVRINNNPIDQKHEMKTNDVLRLGNSHLRLEAAGAPAEEAVAEVELEVLDEGETEEEEEGDVLPPSLTKMFDLENQVLGHHQIGGPLGQGHSGLIFRAHDTKTKHDVALKVFLPEFPANAAETQKFVATLKLVAPLHHPNLATFLGTGRTGSYCWIAREFIDGEDIRQLVKRLVDEDKLGWKTAARAAVHVARALAFLHKNKVVHGNITPNNVIRNMDKVTKLTDTMLHKALEGSQIQNNFVERKFLEELPYLPPEQLEGDTPPNEASDLYGLGAVVYHLLTGDVPFKGDSTDAIIAKIRDLHVKKPSRLVEGVPGSLDHAVVQLLEKDPRDRYPSAAALLHALEPLAKELKA